MIDLHSHLLHGVDDGAASLEDAVMLARIAARDGIHTAVLTPHVHPGRYDGNVRSKLVARAQAFQAELTQRRIPLRVLLGGEVRLCMESLELILEEEVPFLGSVDGFRVMLLEFPHHLIPLGSQQFVNKLLQLNIRPLIAHPERNKEVMANPEKMRWFVDSGCWLQVTAGSLVGRFGEASRATATYLLEQEWVHVIATDAHNLRHRPPLLAEGRRAAAAIVGEAIAEQLVLRRPARILGL